MVPSDLALRTDALTVHYTVGRQTVHAVESVSLELKRGETLAIVGESGCGKSSLARTIVGLETPKSGTIIVNGVDVSSLKGARRNDLHNAIQMVFQDPYASFNPRKKIGRSLQNALTISGKSLEEQLEWREYLLTAVALNEDVLAKYPHEFSGGQRQRLAIVRALCTGAKIIVCDEPVSALDVSVQGQILNMMVDLQSRLGLSYLFISHDLAVVKHIADYVAVMYLGKVMEQGPRSSFWPDAAHPYSEMLMNAVPGVSRPPAEPNGKLADEDVSALNPPPGCVFHTRCPAAIEDCSREVPILRPEKRQRAIACHCR